LAELSKPSFINDDNLTYESIVTVYLRVPDETITALTDDGIEEADRSNPKPPASNTRKHA